MLAIILGIIFFLMSPWGMLTAMAGVFAYIMSPMIHRVTGVGRPIANLPLWIVGKMLGRGAIVVSEHNDLILKQMNFDDLGVETINFGDERKEFEDPDGALHSFLGMTFAFADERHGVLFDPRHSAAGKRRHDADTKGEGIVPATTDEWEKEDVVEWVRGVFEFPTTHELVDLADVRHLVDGGERAENPKQTEEIYKNSRHPFNDGTPAMKFVYPIIALVGPFFGSWVLSTQLGTSTGSVVGFGSALWILFSTGGIAGKDIKSVLKTLAVTLAGLLPVGALFVFMGPITAFIILTVFAFGYFLIPIIALASNPSAKLSSAFASMLLTQGLFAYDQPVIEWTPRKYRLREFSELDDAKEVRWYHFAGSQLGVTFQPGAESWGAEYMPHGELESRRMDDIVTTDGGAMEGPMDSSTNIPAGFVPYNFRNRGGRGAFGPKRLKDSAYYLHSGILMQRFEDTATGEKSMRRLTDAKEKHGEGGFGLSDKNILYATVGCGIFSMAGSIMVFFL